MTTLATTLGRFARPALLAILSAALLAACGGGDADEVDAAAATGLADASTAPAVTVEAAQSHASRTPAGGWRRGCRAD